MSREALPLIGIQAREASGQRRKGYVARCLELGKLDESTGIVHFTPQAWLKIREEDFRKPTLRHMAGDIMDTAGRVINSAVRGEPILRSAEERGRLLSICERCEAFDHRSRRCRACLCFEDIKTWIGAARCPLGKW